jgi:radical SAM protein with 4Fe4S-binding SPASM domain
MIKPVKVFYHITSMCNLSCKHCYFSGGVRRRDELNTEEKLILIDKFAEIGIRKIDFLGGEPTILPDFFEVLNYALNLIFRDGSYVFKEINVQTNGVVFPANFLYLKRKPNIIISIEDTRQEVNDYIRGEGSLKSLIKTAVMAKKFGFNVILRATIFQNNDIDKLVEWANKLKVDLILTSFRPSGRGISISKLVPTAERLADVYIKVMEAQKNSKQTIQISDPQFYLVNKYLYSKYSDVFKENGSICDACYFRLSVDVNGDCYPCFLLHDKKFLLGNILKDDFKIIHRNCEKFVEKRLKLSVGDNCYNCPFLKVCKGCSFINFLNKEINDKNCPIPILIKRGLLAKVLA